MELPNKILELLKEEAKREDERYINPYFLGEIEKLLFDYYNLEDDEVSD